MRPEQWAHRSLRVGPAITSAQNFNLDGPSLGRSLQWFPDPGIKFLASERRRDYCRQLSVSVSSLGCRELSSSGSKADLVIGIITTVVALILLIAPVRRWALKCELENTAPRADHSGYAKD